MALLIRMLRSSYILKSSKNKVFIAIIGTISTLIESFVSD